MLLPTSFEMDEVRDENKSPDFDIDAALVVLLALLLLFPNFCELLTPFIDAPTSLLPLLPDSPLFIPLIFDFLMLFEDGVLISPVLPKTPVVLDSSNLMLGLGASFGSCLSKKISRIPAACLRFI